MIVHGRNPQGACARHRSERRHAGGRTHKRGLNTKVHLAVDAHGMPLRVVVTAGPVADCAQARALTRGMAAGHLVADKGYDTNEIVADAQQRGMAVVIPPRKHRRDYDRYLYRLRHLVENAILKLKGWRGIATARAF